MATANQQAWADRLIQLRALVDDLAPAEVDAVLLFATQRHERAYVRTGPLRVIDTAGLTGTLLAVANDVNREGLRRHRRGDAGYEGFEILALAETQFETVLSTLRGPARG